MDKILRKLDHAAVLMSDYFETLDIGVGDMAARPPRVSSRNTMRVEWKTHLTLLRVSSTSKGGNTSFAKKPELILLKITSFFSQIYEGKNSVLQEIVL